MRRYEYSGYQRPVTKDKTNLGGFSFFNYGALMRFTVLIFTSLLLAGCSSNLQSYGNIDHKAKSITVPAGSQGLKGDMKKALHERGWKMTVYSGPEILEGSTGTALHLQKYQTFNTRYTLIGYDKQVDSCIIAPYIRYEVAVIDNKNGSEVFSLDGSDCQSTALQNFIKAIEAQ